MLFMVKKKENRKKVKEKGLLLFYTQTYAKKLRFGQSFWEGSEVLRRGCICEAAVCEGTFEAEVQCPRKGQDGVLISAPS